MYLLNIEGYWNPLITLLDHVIANGFADESLKASLNIVDDVETLMKAISA